MATILSHPAIPLALGWSLGKKTIPFALLRMGMWACVAADADCLGFAFGIPYESPFGHRGFTHSIVFAAVFAAIVARFYKSFGVSWKIVFPYIFASALSHPLIDAITDGGKGIAFFWPFSNERYFFSWQIIPVSPIGGGFFSSRGMHVFLTELAMIWLPCLMIGGVAYSVRKLVSSKADA